MGDIRGPCHQQVEITGVVLPPENQRCTFAKPNIPLSLTNPDLKDTKGNVNGTKGRTRQCS